ncbi:MAG TPA: glycosyltransferase family 39 protein, partial [Chloroflexia bacterium]|nr:glycosyltransferase family 39 protein [Chloroflexia bacterium]
QLPDIPSMLGAVLSNPPSDPLYVLLLRPWVALFGTGDVSVRAMSVLLSTATLPATYWLGRVVAGRAVGLVGALLLAVSPYAVELGQEAALYVLAALTTTLAFASGWRWRVSGGGAALYVALGILAIYSHYVVLPILALFGLLALHPAAGPRRVSARAWLVAHGVIFAAWLPWLVALIVSWQSSPLPRATLRHPATLEEVLGALVKFTSGSASLLQGERVLEAIGLLAGAGLFAAGWWAGQDHKRRALRLVVVISAIIFLLPAIISAATGLWLFVDHFMLFLLPALLVVLAASQQLQLRIANFDLRNWLIPILAMWLVAQVWGLALYHRYPPHGADGLRELAAILRRGTQPGDVVLVTPPALTPTLRQYYGGDIKGLPSDFDLRAVYLPYEPGRWYSESASALETATQGRNRFWLVYRSEQDEGGKLLQTVSSRFDLVERHMYPYATLYLFSR